MRQSNWLRRAADPGPRRTTPAEGTVKTRFAADSMLGSLSRKLRAIGFDTVYFKGGEDSELVALCQREGRALLTSDRALVGWASARRVAAILVVGETDAQRITSIAKSAAAVGLPLERGDPLCSLCNGDLVRVPRESVSTKIPEAVKARHREYFQCSACGHLYWKGTHWKKLRSLRSRLGSGTNDTHTGAGRRASKPGKGHPRVFR